MIPPILGRRGEAGSGFAAVVTGMGGDRDVDSTHDRAALSLRRRLTDAEVAERQRARDRGGYRVPIGAGNERSPGLDTSGLTKACSARDQWPTGPRSGNERC
jgi:hypothetical protein